MEAIQRDRAASMEKGMRRFTGRLTREQRARLSTWASGLEPTSGLALEQRRDWQAQFAQALSIRNDRPAFETAMDRLLDPGAHQSESYRSRMQANRNHTLETLATIHRLASKRQLARTQDRLAELTEDLEQLTCG
ncbi:MAG: DUF6279 family lipoprotein [Xanthomonadales bacterium]|nr:DUF6279 family lipoprotein [Xanthomonadales bacterium]